MTTSSASAADSPVLVERRGPTAILTLNRPAAMNALSIELVAALEQSVRDLRGLAAAGDVRALVITGAGGKAFCAGADLKERRGVEPGGNPRVFGARGGGLGRGGAVPPAGP